MLIFITINEKCKIFLNIVSHLNKKNCIISVIIITNILINTYYTHLDNNHNNNNNSAMPFFYDK